MRNGTLVRVLRLRQHLEGWRYAPPLAQLADRFGVTTRTIRRDLAALEAAGERVPIYRHNRTKDAA